MARSWRSVLVVLFGAAVLGGAEIGPPAVAQDSATPPLSREAVEAIVREYLLKNPELIMESVRAYQQRQQAQERERVAGVLAARRAELFQDPDAPVAGHPAGDVTVVEFFDYRCGYCKSVAPAVRQLLEQDPNVRLVYKEFPILGPDSVVAARAALAARAQGHYVAFHNALMAASGGSLTLADVLRIAGQVKLDTVRLQADMEAPEIRALVQKNFALAQELGIRGTPVFVVETEVVPGAMDLAALKDLVARARAK
jgi:protein-disulfide isomerase